jgi:hypothetical protein
MALPMQTTTHDGLSRARLLRGLAVGGVAFATPATALSFLAAPARAATPDADLAWLRVLVGVELLAMDFHPRGVAAGKLGRPATQVLKRIAGGDSTHNERLARVLSDAGQAPATAEDMDFTYPNGTFATAGSILRIALKIETLSVGAYLGALGTVESADLRLLLARVAVSEGQHAAAVARMVGHPAIGNPFPEPRSIDAVSTALDAYEG